MPHPDSRVRSLSKVDAIILTGGRSARLEFSPKFALMYRGHTLLEHTIAALAGVRRIAVVGPQPSVPLPSNALIVREDPAFGGPAAAIAAGASALSVAGHETSRYSIVLACDMPQIAPAVQTLFNALDGAEGFGGVIAVDSEGQRQPLVAIYDTARLVATINDLEKQGPLAGLSARRLIRDLSLIEVPIPANASDDVDTWADADRLGIEIPPGAAKASAEERA